MSDSSDAERVLVVGPGWVGDMVMAQSLLTTVARRRPHVRIDVLAQSSVLPLLSRMPEVGRAIEVPIGHGELSLSTRYRLARRLRRTAYSQAIVLPNSLKSSLIPFWARVPRRTGYLGEYRFGLLNDIRPFDGRETRSTVVRFAALGIDPTQRLDDAVPRPRLNVDAGSVSRTAHALALQLTGRPLLALCPGAEFGPAKRWPAERFAQLAAAMLAQGWAVWLFGSRRDVRACKVISSILGGRCDNLAGRTTLAQAVDLMSLTDVVVSNDSGLMHVAAALGRPVVGVYGSSDPRLTPPLSSRSRVVYLGIECSPCFQRRCPLGHLRCLRDVTVAHVRQAVAELTA